MQSKIYTGQVSHTRVEPIRHSFRYPVYYYAFDLAELPRLDQTCRFFGYDRFQPVSLYSRDYFAPSDEPLLDKVQTFIKTYHPSEAVIGSVQLLTTARYFNYIFNPVSFFYCYTVDQTLACILAYVSNTFSESHVYALNNPLQRDNRRLTRYKIDKDFHVSPFFDRTGTYDFHFAPLADHLDIHIRLMKQEKTVFTARLQGQARLLSSANLLKTISRYPLTASLTMPRIVWEAGKLYYQRRLPVYKKPIATSNYTIRVATPTRFQGFVLQQIIKYGQVLQHGSIEMILPDQEKFILGDPKHGPQYRLLVRDYAFFSRLGLAGEIGFGEAYMAGEWDVDDLPGFLGLLIANAGIMSKQPSIALFFTKIYHYILHRSRKNSKAGSKENIQAHYDLSNQMYQLFLDESLTYSAAVFESPEQSLEAAQRHKLQKIIKKARLKADHQVLEIGSGWGSFAIEAVQQTGCRVTTVTLSEAQYQLAQERIAAAGLKGRIEIKLCDYRRLEGQFDRVVSIEMIEAVGHDFLPDYFKTCDRLLKPQGIMVLQAITFRDQDYDSYHKNIDWIRKHIFPGGHLPSLTAISMALTKHTTLMIDDLENIGPHYAPTLAHWHKRFMAAESTIRTLGFDEEFYRKWVFYFASCEAAFARRYLNNLQLVLTRMQNTELALGLPDSRGF